MIVLGLPLTQLAAQTIKGRLVNSYGEPVEFANVCLLSMPDSAFISGTTSKDDGRFTIETTRSRGLLRVSCVNYETLYLECDIPDVGIIVLKESEKMLSEVVVTGSNSMYKMNAEGLTATIQGSVLAKLGSLTDVLDQLPFVSAGSSGISVLGKGSPVVYIDGRRITNNNDLVGIKSNQIKDIQVIMNPGSRYPSNVGSVIRITTIRRQGDGLSGTLQWTGKVNSSFRQDDYVMLNYRIKGFDIFGSMYYRSAKSEQEQTNDLSFRYNGAAISVYNDSRQISQTQHLIPRLGMNYSSVDNSLYAGVQYSYQRTIKTPFEQISRYVSADMSGQHTWWGRYASDNTGGMHNADAYILKTFKNKWQLDFNMTFTGLDLSTDLATTEVEGIEIVDVGSLTERRSNMLAEKLTMKKKADMGEFVFGEEYTYTNSRQTYTVSNASISMYLQSNSNHVSQNAIAVFGEYAKSWKSTHLNVGLRYEYVSYIYDLNGMRQENQSRNYGRLMPTIALNYKKERFGVILSFRSTIERPSYQQLRSSMAFDNRYLYEGGNPALQPCYKYDFGLLMRYSDLVLSANYIHFNDAIMFCHYQLDDAPVAVSSFANVDYNSANVMASYAPTLGKWKPSVTVQAYLQDLEHDGEKYNHPRLTYSFKNIISLPQSFIFTLNLAGSTSGDNYFMSYRPNFSASASLIRNFRCGLQLTLGIQDIFRSTRENWCMRVDGVESVKWLKSDSRLLYFTIRYNFNSARSKYKGTGAGNEEKSRL